MATPAKGQGRRQGKSAKSPQGSGPLATLDEQGQAEVVAEVIEENPALLEQPVVKAKLVAMMQKHHSGPLPAPEDFAAYEQALPGACDRILKMAEKQQDHVYSINNKRLDGDMAEAKRGQVLAFIIAMGGVGSCVWTASIGAPWQVSVGLGAGGVALLIAPFLRRNKD